MLFEYRVVRHDADHLKSSFSMRQVSRKEDNLITNWISSENISAPNEPELGNILVLMNQAMLKPVLEVTVDIQGRETLRECEHQPDRWSIPQSNHWKKAVIYHKNNEGKLIDHRRDCDNLYWIKVRDYTRPIAAFKAKKGVEFPFFYVSRGDGLIVATYWDDQVVKEALLDAPF